MRKTTTFFILAEAGDLLTTIIGLNVGCVELNPMGEIIIPKILATFLVAWILEIKNPNRLDVAIPIIAAIPIPWNLLNILLLF